jgi:hypothetical protein
MVPGGTRIFEYVVPGGSLSLVVVVLEARHDTLRHGTVAVPIFGLVVF